MKKALTMALLAVMAGGSVMAQAYEKGDWVLRAGATTVDPDTDSELIDASIPYKVDVDDDTQLGLIPLYMATEKVAIELLAATPFEHDIGIDGTSIAAGSTKHLPPTLSVQWHPRGGQSGWQPYIGLGVNYTIFFDEDVDNELIQFLGVDDADLDLDDSFGLAGQAGVDIPFGEHWAVNFAVWYIDIDTTAEVTAKVNGATAAKVKFDVDIDPWVYNIGIAYKF
jgi:outer membrane protein